MKAHSYNAVLIHYGELALKGGNRSWFEGKLIGNIARAVASHGPYEVRRLPGRVWIDASGTPVNKELLKQLQAVFGVANLAPALRVEPTLSEIERGVDLLVSEKSFKSFAIRARRSEKKFPMTSMELNCHIGALVEKGTGARVDLSAPELAIDIELLEQHAFLFCDRLPGPGGLPIGSSGKVAVLISGGIDSPVAAWRMMKRGCTPFFIHFHSGPYTSLRSVEKVIDLVEVLSRGVGGVRIAIVPFGEVQQKIIACAPEEYRVLLYRRMMFRIAEILARKEGAVALVTGEALSQVASQTLSNLAAIESCVKLPLLRPLVGMDKQEIVNEARRIETFEIACEPHDDCCSFLVPKHPATKSSADGLDRIEAPLDVPSLVQLGLQGVELRTIT